MPDQCYFEGNFYQCTGIAVPGENPGNTPDKWRPIHLLKKWRFALAHLTYAELLRLDGQTDKAAVEKRRAKEEEHVGLSDLIRGEATAEERQRTASRRGGPAGVRSTREGYVNASVILDDAYRLIGWEAAQLDTRDKQDARMALSQAVQEVWEAWWWQELMQCDRLQFADTLDATATYQAGNTIYDPAADEYRTALRETTGSETDSFELYEACEACHGARERFASTSDYTAGDQFTYGNTNYQAHTDYEVGDGSLVVSGAGTSAVNGTYERESALNYIHTSGEYTLTLIEGEGWYVYNLGAVVQYFCEEDNFPFGPWVTHLGDEPAPTVTGGPPTDTNFFAPLQNWQPQLPWTSTGAIPQEPFGPIRGVSNFDPRCAPNSEFYELQVIQNYTRVVGLTNTHPWVWARRVTPVLTGDDYDEETEYTATPTGEVVFATDDDAFLHVQGGYLQIQV